MSNSSGLLALCTATDEPIRAEPLISRRTFLTGILATGLAPAWLEALPDLSSNQAVNEVWDDLLEDPVAFFVDADGTLGLGLKPESPRKSRSEAFDVLLSELESPSRLSSAAESVQPIQWELENALGDLRDEFLRETQDWQTARHIWSDETGQAVEEYPSDAAIQILRDLPEDPPAVDDMEEFLQSLPEDLFDRLRARLAAWLEGKPDWGSEEDHFAPWFRQQEGALRYFDNLGFSRDVFGELGVKIVEGEHPGSTYYAAELRLSLEEANRRARQLGIPVLFVESEEPSR